MVEGHVVDVQGCEFASNELVVDVLDRLSIQAFADLIRQSAPLPKSIDSSMVFAEDQKVDHRFESKPKHKSP